jgi:hypothetical protein
MRQGMSFSMPSGSRFPDLSSVIDPEALGPVAARLRHEQTKVRGIFA